MNQVMLVGRLGADPEYTKTQSGKTVCRFRLATSRYSKQDGVTADWHHVSAWESLAETCVKYLQKGNKVAVLGRLQTDQYTAKDGHPRSITKVVAKRVEFFREPGTRLTRGPVEMGGEGAVEQKDDLPF